MKDIVLTSGMVFESPKEASEYIGFYGAKKNDSIYRALRHYCKFHKDEKLRIYIDDVFENPIPFLRNDFVYEIGEIHETKYGKYQIIDRYLKYRQPGQKNKTRLYKCKCLVDGYEFEENASEIQKGRGCLMCRRRQIEKGNSLYKERPDLLIYLKNPDDAKNYAPSSGKKILCKCPDCGTEKEVIIENLSKNGFSCTACGDGVSYPNKFVNELLNQLGVEHVMEAQFPWSGKHRYDQYLPTYSMVIENNGLQHYLGEARFQFPMQDLEKQKKNDVKKKSLAEKNGIERYVYIDCSYSSVDWMRSAVMSSELPSILSFSEDDIDWGRCSEVASTSLVRQAWEMWNRGLPYFEISKEIGVCPSTVRTYINRGIDLGICKPFYHADKEIRDIRRRNHTYTNGTMKPISCVTDNVYFACRFDCEEYYSDLFPKSGAFLLYKNITRGVPYKGKEFIYISKKEFNEKLNDPACETYGKPYRI